MRRGSLGRFRAGPDADLRHLPIGLDFRAVSIAEGVRAALAVAVVVVVTDTFDIPALGEVSLGALLCCLCDPGGPIRRRVPALLSFAVLGSVAIFLFGLLRAAGVVPGTVGGVLFVFGCMYARVWGPVAMQVGNLLTVVAILALDHGRTGAHAATMALLFGGGALWAVLLSLVIWRLHPFLPARVAVADVYRRIGLLAGDLSEQMGGAGRADWTAHARGHRRYVRDGLEAARTELVDVLGRSGQGGPRGNALIIQLEAAEQVFGVVIALSDLLEYDRAGLAETCRTLLPALRLLLAGIADDIVADRPDDAAHRALFLRLLGQVEGSEGSPALGQLTRSLQSTLRIAALMTTPEGRTVDGGSRADRLPLLPRIAGPVRANFRWESASLRHAIRAAALAAPALLVTLPIEAAYAHWLTITLLLTLQPFFALTWQRAVERIGGTLLGGLLAAALSVGVHDPAFAALFLFPLAIAAFAVRRVSYGLFMVALTPLIVVLSELGQPGTGEITIALYRAGFTLAGGAMAVLAGITLWPSWEPARVQADLRAAVRAHAAFADAELAVLSGEVPAGGADAARRAAGMASNNLETTLSRALQEPRQARKREIRQALVADAALRRVAGRLAALQHAPGLAGTVDLPRWRAWLAASFGALTGTAARPGQPPDDADGGSLGRIARQIELIEGALRPAAD